jgi:hypothetical protein
MVANPPTSQIQKKKPRKKEKNIGHNTCKFFLKKKKKIDLQK